MADTLFADVSEFQTEVDDRYPYHFFAFRSNDGTYRDHHFQNNLSWSVGAAKTDRLAGFLCYFVWEMNWQDSIATFKSQIGKPSRYMAVILDVESWAGKISGNQSLGMNATREDLIKWLQSYRRNALSRRLYRGRDRRRVVVYGNTGDLSSLMPQRGDANIVLAAYGVNPSFPNKVAHQFSDHYPCAPFGYCDMNSADGLTPQEFAKVLGLDRIKPHRVKRVPAWPLGTNQAFGEAPPNFSGRRHVKIHVEQIKLIQKALVKKGYAPKVDAAKWIDGSYGSSTAAAVVAMKKDIKWTNHSPRVGRHFWKRLFK